MNARTDGDLNVGFMTVFARCVLLQDTMMLLREQWNKLDARARAPYEARAAHDANRYRREVPQCWNKAVAYNGLGWKLMRWELELHFQNDILFPWNIVLKTQNLRQNDYSCRFITSASLSINIASVSANGVDL